MKGRAIENDNHQTLRDFAQENVETIIDGLTHLTLEAKIDPDALELLEDIPVIKNIAAILSIYGTVRNRHVAKKIAVFVNALHQGKKLNEAGLIALREKYGDDRILEEVVIRMDRLRSEIHAEIYANLYRATVDGSISWDRFTQLADALEGLSVTDIRNEDENSDSGPSFVASGLAYVYFPQVLGGGAMEISKNGHFYNDFLKYGLGPYKAAHIERAEH